MKFIHVFLLLFAVGASSQTVYKTPSGEKYHVASCRMVKNVSQKITIADAQERGLQPCKICKPPVGFRQNVRSTKNVSGESATVRCKGLTQKGTRCKHMTRIANGYCFQHNK